MLGCMAELGTDVACFSALHNAYPPRKGDYGYLSSDDVEYALLQLLRVSDAVQHLKGTMVAATSDDPLVAAYSSRHEFDALGRVDQQG